MYGLWEVFQSVRPLAFKPEDYRWVVYAGLLNMAIDFSYLLLFGRSWLRARHNDDD
jgi:hypothetical protein